jgi:phage protein D
MSLRRPQARIGLGGRALTAAEAALADLRVVLSTGAVHDLAVLRLDAASPFAGVSAGADATVELGYGEDTETVFTGTVATVGVAAGQLTVVAVGTSARASGVRVGRSYVGSTAGDVVSDLLSTARVDTGDVRAPLALAAYHLDERRTAWQHVADVARLAGCEVTTEGDGSVNVCPPRAGALPGTTLRFGAELVAWTVGPAGPAEAAVDVVPYGAASEKGSQGWHLLLREPDGGSPSTATRVPAALRDRDGAASLGDALAAARARRESTGSLVAVGTPAVRAGHVVRLQDLPGGAGPSTVRATSVEHCLGGGAGFVTRLRVEAAG